MAHKLRTQIRRARIPKLQRKHIGVGEKKASGVNIRRLACRFGIESYERGTIACAMGGQQLRIKITHSATAGVR